MPDDDTGAEAITCCDRLASSSAVSSLPKADYASPLHVSEPAQLSNEEAVGCWRETIEVGRAVEQTFEHAKMNYQTLGNNVPHLHAHIVPWPLLDPAPNEFCPGRIRTREAKTAI